MLDSTTKEFSQFPLSEKKNTTKLDMSHTYVELKTPQRRNRDFEGKPGLFEPESTSRISQDSSTFWNSSGKFKYFCRKRFFPAAILDGLKSRKKTAVSGARLRSLEHAVARASSSGSHASTDNAAHGGALVYVEGARDAIETFDMGSHSTNLSNHALTAVDSSADSHESFAQGRIQQLEQELAHVQQEVVTIDRIYQEKLKTEVSCKAKLSQALASVQDEVRALREETNSLQQDLESAEEHANSLQQTNVQLAQQLTNARAQQREHEKASRNHAEQARRQQQRADELAAARQEQEDALDDATQELRDTKNRLAASEQQRRPLADTGSARDVVASAVTQLAHVLTDRMPVTAAATRTADCSTNRVDSLTKIVARQSSAKDLPTFSGDPTAWPMFIHAFRGSTTECEFSNQENSARLLKALKGKALDTVKAMLVIPDNLERVIRTLQMRYGQPDQVVQAMIDGVKQLRVLRDDDFEQLIDLSNAVGNLVATMHLMDHIGHLTNPQLRQEVVHRLPSSLQRQWGETIAKKEQRDINLQTLADWLAERADAVCCIRKITAKPAETTQKHTPSHRRPFGTREAVYTTSSQPTEAVAHRTDIDGPLLAEVAERVPPDLDKENQMAPAPGKAGQGW